MDGPAQTANLDFPLPEPVLFACGKVAAFHPAGARAWMPAQGRVQLYESTSTSPPDPWPADVPLPPADLFAPGKTSGSYILEGKPLGLLMAFVAGPPRRWSVLVRGRPLTVKVETAIPAEPFLKLVVSCVSGQAWADGGVPAVCKEESVPSGSAR
jgi:hypothetical protein